MQTNGQGILGVFARQFRRLVSSFREKPTATLDDYLLEHFMLYHGLVGTSPENQPRERDLRADIFDALKHRSASELAIALKIPPLWWQDKLPAIMQAAHKEFGNDVLISCLLPEGDEFQLQAESDPLRHPDWRVRSNAARTLAQFGAVEAVPRMVNALNDNDAQQKTAFCHIAYSLAQLRTPQSRLALSAHLLSDEPWFRVDSAGALARWPLNEVAEDLMSAVMEPHALTDYMAVAIAREHQPAELLRQQDELLQEGALEIIIGLLQAAKGTFTSEVLIEARVQACLPRVVELAQQHGTPRRWRAVASVCDWIAADVDEITAQDRTASASKLLSQVEEARAKFTAQQISPVLLNWFERYKSGSIDRSEGKQIRHAVKLASELRLKEAAPYVIPLVSKDSPALNESIEAIADLGIPEAASQLIDLAATIVDLGDRTTRALSKQPVFEDDPATAKTYWHLLRAMASLPTDSAANYLLKASNDFAPDKRQQALSSLVALGQAPELRERFQAPIGDRVRAALSDPSPQVRTAALQGVGELGMDSLLEDVLQLANAPETAVWRQAANTLKHLHAEGASAKVEQSLDTAISQERDQFKKDRLKKLRGQLR